MKTHTRRWTITLSLLQKHTTHFIATHCTIPVLFTYFIDHALLYRHIIENGTSKVYICMVFQLSILLQNKYMNKTYYLQATNIIEHVYIFVPIHFKLCLISFSSWQYFHFNC